MATSIPSTFPSILTHPPHVDTSSAPPRPHPVWRYHPHTSFPSNPPSLHPTELVVRINATGICHTDVFISSIPPGAFPGMGPYPKILGHEGAGTVVAIGSNVTEAKPGDKVLLSYDYCGTCKSCLQGHGNTCDCESFTAKNTGGQPSIFTTKSDQGSLTETSGKFFGQSSFSSYTLVEQNSVVNVTSLIKNQDELKLLAPLGCGLMTGAGAMVNVANLTSDSVVLVLGAGAVGMGAVMAARNLGAKGVIVVDRVKHRLDTAREVGATEVLDTTGLDPGAVPDELRKLAEKISGDPMAISTCFETTGNVAVTQAGMAALGKSGLLIAVGIPPPDGKFEFTTQDVYFLKKRYVMNILGNSESRVMIPKMIDWWREGRFEVEKFVRFYKAEEAEKALEGMEGGESIKPVLLWD